MGRPRAILKERRRLFLRETVQRVCANCAARCAVSKENTVWVCWTCTDEGYVNYVLLEKRRRLMLK